MPAPSHRDRNHKTDLELVELFRSAVSDSIGSSLREARQHARMTQEHVARAMGISRSRVAQIESSEGASLSLRNLLKYAHAVGCRLDIDLVDPDTDEAVTSILLFDDEPNATVFEFSAHATRTAPRSGVLDEAFWVSGDLVSATAFRAEAPNGDSA